MGSSRTTFEKLQRERRKKAKAEAKREKRRRRAAGIVEGSDDAAPDAKSEESIPDNPADLLDRIERVHRQFEAGTITFEEFEETKQDLYERLASLPAE